MASSIEMPRAPRRATWRRGVQVVLGGLLIASGVLKLTATAADPLFQTGFLAAPWFRGLVIQLELLLGVWLASGAWPALSWATALLTFIGFAGFSLYAGVVGRASCGCFGDHPVSPWYAFAVDVAAVGLLVLVRPDFAGARRVNPGRWALDRLPLAIGAGAAVAVAAWTGAGWKEEARPAESPVVISPGVADLGPGRPGEFRDVRFEVRNTGPDPVRVIGTEQDCSVRAEVPGVVPVPAGESRAVTLRFRFPPTPGVFHRPVRIWVEAEHVREVSVVVQGRAE